MVIIQIIYTYSAISESPNHVAIEKSIEDGDYLKKLFRESTNEKFPPSNVRNNIAYWYTQIINIWVQEKKAWFSDETNEFMAELSEHTKSHPVAISTPENVIRADIRFNEFFEKTKKAYVPLLIPPKRRLQTNVKLAFNEPFLPSGEGILNRLFFLKSQDLKSREYKKYETIYNLFEEVTGLSFAIFPNSSNVLSLSYGHDGNWLSANDSGLGLSDVLIIITHIVDADATFIFIEEPENHLHAVFQKRLLAVLKKTKEKQFFLSTHSSVFLDPVVVDKIFYTSCDEYVLVSDETSRSEMIASLGYSVAENLVSDAIILTEGPSDIRVLRTLFSWTNTLQDFNLRFWPLGGDIMAELDLSVFRESKRVFAIVDNDPGSSVARTRFIRNCEKYDIPNLRLERYSIENYVSVGALRKIFPYKISQNLKAIDPNIKVDDQVRLKKSVKSKIHEVFEIMNQEELEETDLWDFVKMVDETLRKENKTVEMEDE